MRHSSPLLRALTALVLVSTVASSQAAPAGQSQRLRSHDDLVRFFTEWRQFQRPKLVDGVPDYTAPAMTAQYRALTSMKRRLAAFDTTGWSVAQQVDYQVVRAEMNGLDFDHRVLKPWANNPAYYVTVFSDQSDQPAREGPFAYGSIELWLSLIHISEPTRPY